MSSPPLQQLSRGNTTPLANRIKVSPLFLQVVLLVVTFVATDLIGAQGGWDAEKRLTYLSWAVLVQLPVQLFILQRCYRNLIAPPLVFSFLLSIFTSGWLILRAFDATDAPNDVVGRLSTEAINSAAEFYLLAFASYGVGAVWVASRRSKEKSGDHESNLAREGAVRSSLETVGGWCILLGIGPFAVANINNLFIIFTQGYSAYYVPGNRLSSPILVLAPFFIVGLVMYGVAAEPQKARWARRALLAVAAVRLLAGDRGEGFIYLLAFVMMLHYAPTGQVRARASRVRLAVFGVASIIVIPLVGNLRQGFGGNASADLSPEHPIVGTLRTLGGTIYPLVTSMQLVPATQSHLDGGSYLSGVLRIVPGPLRPTWSVDPLYSSPAVWLQEEQGLSYGPGFTPFAEAFVNFGVVGGCVTLFLFGVLSSHVLQIKREASTWRIAFVIVVFALCGFTVRSSFNFAVPFIFRYAMIPLFIASLVATSRLSARQKSETAV